MSLPPVEEYGLHQKECFNHFPSVSHPCQFRCGLTATLLAPCGLMVWEPDEAERQFSEQRERWLVQQDEVLTWRLRTEVAEAQLQERQARTGQQHS